MVVLSLLMQKIFRKLLLGFAACLLIQACATPMVYVPVSAKITRPAEFSLKGIKKIAVMDFKGDTELAQALRGSLVSSLFEGKRFTVLERQEMQTLLEEQKLTGAIVDERSAQIVGKMLGVDALVIGELSGERVEEAVRNVQDIKAKGEGTPGGETAPEAPAEGEVQAKETYQTLIAHIRVNLRVVHIGTGELAAAKTISLNQKWAESNTSWGNSTQSLLPNEKYHYVSPLPEKQDALKDLASLAGQACARAITPYTDEVNLVYERGCPAMEEGFAFLDAGLIKEAQESWEKAAEEDPDNPSIHFNLGVFYETQGEVIKARDQYRRAMEIRQDRRTMEAFARIRNRVGEAEKLKSQIGPE